MSQLPEKHDPFAHECRGCNKQFNCPEKDEREKEMARLWAKVDDPTIKKDEIYPTVTGAARLVWCPCRIREHLTYDKYDYYGWYTLCDECK